MKIQTLLSDGCNEETTCKYEDKIKSLKEKLGMTKLKLHNTEQELVMIRTEKNILLMEISFNEQDLSEADRKSKMKTHHIVQSYEIEIHDLKLQIADLQAAQMAGHSLSKSSLIGTTSERKKNHGISFSNPHLHSTNENNNNECDREKKGKKKKKRSKKDKTRNNEHFPVSDETLAVPLIGLLSSFQPQPIHLPNFEDAETLFSNYEGDIIEKDENKEDDEILRTKDEN